MIIKKLNTDLINTIEGRIPFKEMNDEKWKFLRNFILEKWQKMDYELKDFYEVNDMSFSCKFTSLFCAKLFRGYLRGNKYHNFAIVDNYIIDPTNPSWMFDRFKEDNIDPYLIDNEYLCTIETQEWVDSCTPRVEGWIEEFIKEFNNKF